MKMNMDAPISEDKALLKEKLFEILKFNKEVSSIPIEINGRLFCVLKNTGELVVYVTIIDDYPVNRLVYGTKITTDDCIGWHPVESRAQLNELLSHDQEPTIF